MSISKYLGVKNNSKKSVVEEKDNLGRLKIIVDNSKSCPTCDKHIFDIIYKGRTKKIIAYKCSLCGDSILIDKRSDNKNG